jgi:hypothetical protein
MADCECSVCYEGFTTAEGAKTSVVTLSCGHPFHFACITKWFSGKAVGTCPMCRKGMTGVDALGGADEADEADEGEEAAVTAVASAPRLPEWATAGETSNVDEVSSDPPVMGSFMVTTWDGLREQLRERGGSELREDMAVMCEPPTPDSFAEYQLRCVALGKPAPTAREISWLYLTRPVLNVICRVTGARLWSDQEWFDELEMDYACEGRALPWEFEKWAGEMEGVARGARWAAAQAT